MLQGIEQRTGEKDQGVEEPTGELTGTRRTPPLKIQTFCNKLLAKLVPR